MELNQIKELVKDRPHRQEIDRGTIHQNRLRFHTETEILKAELSPYYNDFVAWICTEKPELLPKDKVERFKQLLTTPLTTIELTSAIATDFSRVFEGQDKFLRYDFDSDELLSDWNDFRDEEFWRSDAFQAMINAIDSVWVIDLPSEQEGDKPEPKNMLIDIMDVIDLSVKNDGECNYVIFSLGDKLFVYDEEMISSYEYKDKKIGVVLSELKHELGYCPARMFWSDYLKKKNFINHKSPFTSVLSDLDWLLVHRTFKKYMDIANSYPILTMYEMKGDSTDMTPVDNKGRSEKQQKTLGASLPGPGTILTLPHPLEGQPDLMANPVKWIAPEITSLEFHVKEDDRLTEYIYKSTVGVDGEQTNDQARNEKQVLASFENQSIVLRRIAVNFEKIQAFAEKTIIKMRYGVDAISEVSIDYGTKFFLKTADDLMKEKETAAGDDIILDALSSELIETMFRNDSAGKTRANVISDLDPAPGKNLEEVIKIKNAGGMSSEAFKIKVNLMKYVRRFEREQLPIAQFMKKGEYSARVDLIKEEFIKYLEDERDDSSEPQTGDTNPQGGLAFVPRPDEANNNQSIGPDTSGDQGDGQTNTAK